MHKLITPEWVFEVARQRWAYVKAELAAADVVTDELSKGYARSQWDYYQPPDVGADVPGGGAV